MRPNITLRALGTGRRQGGQLITQFFIPMYHTGQDSVGNVDKTRHSQILRFLRPFYT